MTPKINDSCIGCGTCEAMCPEVFKIEDQDGKMMAVVQEVDFDDYKDNIKEAVEACPVDAIESV